MIGFLGAYTTFSTLMLESWRLWEDGAGGLALANAFGSVVLGLAAVFVGLDDREGAVMRVEGTGLLARIYIGESDTWHGQPLYDAIVQLLRERGLAGATVLRGIEGYGAKQHLHTTRILRLSEDLPVLIEVVDIEERVRAVLPELDAMVSGGLITLEKVEVIAYRADTAGGPTT